MSKLKELKLDSEKNEYLESSIKNIYAKQYDALLGIQDYLYDNMYYISEYCVNQIINKTIKHIYNYKPKIFVHKPIEIYNLKFGYRCDSNNNYLKLYMNDEYMFTYNNLENKYLNKNIDWHNLYAYLKFILNDSTSLLCDENITNLFNDIIYMITYQHINQVLDDFYNNKLTKSLLCLHIKYIVQHICNNLFYNLGYTDDNIFISINANIYNSDILIYIKLYLTNSNADFYKNIKEIYKNYDSDDYYNITYFNIPYLTYLTNPYVMDYPELYKYSNMIFNLYPELMPATSNK